MKQEERSAERRSRGWVSMVLALVLLVTVGFFGGALVGFFWEEPRLVIAYLGGDTESVEWSQAERPTGPSDVDVAAPPPVSREQAETAAAEVERKAAPPPPPAPAPVVRRAPDPPPAPAAKPAPPPPPAKPRAVAVAPAKPVAPVASAGRFAVQVGAFKDSATAEKLAERLRGKGFSAYVTPSASGNANWRVRVGPVPERAEANRLASRLKREKLPTWVLAEGGN